MIAGSARCYVKTKTLFLKTKKVGNVIDKKNRKGRNNKKELNPPMSKWYEQGQDARKDRNDG